MPFWLDFEPVFMRQAFTVRCRLFEVVPVLLSGDGASEGLLPCHTGLQGSYAHSDSSRSFGHLKLQPIGNDLPCWVCQESMVHFSAPGSRTAS